MVNLFLLKNKMTEINEIYNTFDRLVSPENLSYAIKAVTAGFVISVGAFFYTEFKKFKRAEENKINKSLDNKL